MTYRLVIIESPFAGRGNSDEERTADAAENLRYLRAAMADCLARGEAPFASHGLYTQPGILDDANPEERRRGIAAGFAWRRVAAATVVYVDRGVTSGMRAGMADAANVPGHVIDFRRLQGWGCES